MSCLFRRREILIILFTNYYKVQLYLISVVGMKYNIDVHSISLILETENKGNINKISFTCCLVAHLHKDDFRREFTNPSLIIVAKYISI